MNKILLGATLALGLVLGAASPSYAGPGDGLDRNAPAQGNGNFGGMHRGARITSRQAMMGGRYHRRHHRRYR